MNKELKSIIDEKLYSTFVELAKKDVILQSVLRKANNLPNFVNALLAASICIVDRELSAQEMLKQILEANPEVKQILAIKHDTSMLSKKENP